MSDRLSISVTEARNCLSYWLNKVEDGPITLTRRGEPVGVIISPVEYERLRRVQAYLQMLHISDSLEVSGLPAGELFQTSREELEERQ
jgi:prevent-host-death family protein